MEECILDNLYLSNNNDTAHVRWCEICEQWLHEQCAGQAILRSNIVPSANQAYLTTDTMNATKKGMPSEVEIILGWPICRLLKRFTVKGMEYWYPYSTEICVQKAREWYWKGSVPVDWKHCLMAISADEKFMKGVLEALLEEPYPVYYHCPKCSSYI
jgi:hypothetical protein